MYNERITISDSYVHIIGSPGVTISNSGGNVVTFSNGVVGSSVIDCM